jgi:hypothetical protein
MFPDNLVDGHIPHFCAVIRTRMPALVFWISVGRGNIHQRDTGHAETIAAARFGAWRTGLIGRLSPIALQKMSGWTLGNDIGWDPLFVEAGTEAQLDFSMSSLCH